MKILLILSLLIPSLASAFVFLSTGEPLRVSRVDSSTAFVDDTGVYWVGVEVQAASLREWQLSSLDRTQMEEITGVVVIGDRRWELFEDVFLADPNGVDFENNGGELEVGTSSVQWPDGEFIENWTWSYSGVTYDMVSTTANDWAANDAAVADWHSEHSFIGQAVSGYLYDESGYYYGRVKQCWAGHPTEYRLFYMPRSGVDPPSGVTYAPAVAADVEAGLGPLAYPPGDPIPDNWNISADTFAALDALPMTHGVSSFQDLPIDDIPVWFETIVEPALIDGIDPADLAPLIAAAEDPANIPDQAAAENPVPVFTTDPLVVSGLADVSRDLGDLLNQGETLLTSSEGVRDALEDMQEVEGQTSSVGVDSVDFDVDHLVVEVEKDLFEVGEVDGWKNMITTYFPVVNVTGGTCDYSGTLNLAGQTVNVGFSLCAFESSLRTAGNILFAVLGLSCMVWAFTGARTTRG